MAEEIKKDKREDLFAAAPPVDAKQGLQGVAGAMGPAGHAGPAPDTSVHALKPPPFRGTIVTDDLRANDTVRGNPVLQRNSSDRQ